jgi:citronellol/citronellal dehydrogenase
VSSIDPTKDNRLADLTGRVAIVTGGGTGIGAATARLLARHGADVVIAARTVEDLEHTAQAVEGATGRRCVPVPTDVTDEKQVVSMVERAVDELGRIDILVNNAGGTRMRPLTELSTRSWDAGFNLNVRSAYLCTREAGRHLVVQRSGAIVNVSSRAGVTGVKGGAHYSSSKAALQMFTTVTAAEWGRFGIRANCVAVGLVASERASRPGGWRTSTPTQSAPAPRSVGRARPTRSPTRSTSSQAMPRPTSRAKPSRWTVARASGASPTRNPRRSVLDVLRHGPIGRTTSGSGWRYSAAAFSLHMARSSSGGTWPHAFSITSWVSGQVLSPCG